MSDEIKHSRAVTDHDSTVWTWGGRLSRIVNAIILSRSKSRNEREGVYDFKVAGRHTRKRRPRKIVQLRMSEEVHQKLRALKTATGEAQNAKH